MFNIMDTIAFFKIKHLVINRRKNNQHLPEEETRTGDTKNCSAVLRSVRTLTLLSSSVC